MVGRVSVFRVSASVLERALDLGLIWAWARKMACAARSAVREPSSTSPHRQWVSRRLESNRPRFPSLWCRVRVGTPRSANPAETRWHPTGSYQSSHSGEQESGEADGAAAPHPRHALAAQPTLRRSHARRRSGPESPQSIHALLHSNASVRPRRARPAAGGTSRPRRPATRPRQCVAAEQLRGDDGARLGFAASPVKRARGWRPTRRVLLVPSGRASRVFETLAPGAKRHLLPALDFAGS